MRTLIITMALMLAMPAYACYVGEPNCSQGYGGWAVGGSTGSTRGANQVPPALQGMVAPPPTYGYPYPTVNPQSPNSYRPQRCDAYGRCY
jgi:hypothetical protein